MTDSPVNVYAVEHSFGLFDRYEIPIETADWSTGLIVEMAAGAMIYTGVNRGPVRVATDVRATPPDRIDPGPWDDIVEASLHAPHGELRVQLLEYGQHDQPPPLPPLSPHGPGHYRVRAHARDRDLHFDAAREEPSEDYLLTVWPADPAPALIIRATDQCGYGLRLANTSRPRVVPAPPPELVAERRERARLHDAILDGLAQAQQTKHPTDAP